MWVDSSTGAITHRQGKSSNPATVRTVLLIDEHLRMDGVAVRTHLDWQGGRVTIVSDDGIHGALSVGAIAKVMERYGKPLDATVSLEGPRLTLDDGAALRMLRFRAQVDVIARDYLVWERPGEEPLAALSNGVAAALRYLCLQMAEARAVPDAAREPSGE